MKGDSDSSGTRLQVGERDAALTEVLTRELTAHNMAATGVDAEGAISVKVDDAHGLVAGLTGWTWGACAGISLVWVREDSRGTGLGGYLLIAAEAVAVERGCNRIFVSSFTFQAPGFYAAHGYLETARFRDLLAEGVADVWFVKPLVASAASRLSVGLRVTASREPRRGA